MARNGKLAQRGFTLLETLAVLAIGAMMISGLLAMASTTYSNTRAQQAATYQSQIADAAAQLIKANYTTLLTASMSTTKPIVVSMNSSKPVGFELASFLPASMQGGNLPVQNAYQQTPCLLIYRGTGTGWSGGSGPQDIEAFLVTEGGQTIDDRTLGYIEANGGPGGGAFQSITNGAAQGAFGNWYAPMSVVDPSGASCTGVRTGVGHLASQVYYSGGNGTSGDFLYRQPTSVTGVKDGNTMHAPIFLNDQAHTDRTSDAACGSGVGAGKITADSNGNILNCDGTEWQLQGSMHWRDTVATWADLSSLNSEVGDVVLTADTSRAFVWTGSNWQALAVDQNGNLSVPGYLDLLNNRIEGNACTPDSASATKVATDSNGQVLSCQNGAWEPHMLEFAGNDQECVYILPPSPGANDYPACSPPANWPSANASQVIYDISFPLSKPNVITVSSWAHLDDRVCGSATQNNAKLFLSVDIFENGSAASLYHQEAQSPMLTNDSASVNASISQPVGTGNYTVQISTRWATYGPAGFDTPWTSSHCVNGATVPTSPLVMGYAISNYD